MACAEASVVAGSFPRLAPLSSNGCPTTMAASADPGIDYHTSCIGIVVLGVSLSRLHDCLHRYYKLPVILLVCEDGWTLDSAASGKVGLTMVAMRLRESFEQLIVYAVQVGFIDHLPLLTSHVPFWARHDTFQQDSILCMPGTHSDIALLRPLPIQPKFSAPDLSLQNLWVVDNAFPSDGLHTFSDGSTYPYTRTKLGFALCSASEVVSFQVKSWYSYGPDFLRDLLVDEQETQVRVLHGPAEVEPGTRAATALDRPCHECVL